MMRSNIIEVIELRTMRMFAFIAAIAVAVTGLVTSSLNDPAWERLVIILIAIIPLLLSYVSKLVRDNYHYFLYPMYFAVFTWEAHLAYLNNFNVEEAMSVILIVVLAGLVPYAKYWHFTIFLVYCVLIDLLVILLLPSLGNNRITYSTYILVGGMIAYLLAGSKVRILDMLRVSWTRLQAVSDSASDAIVSVDNKKKIVFWNRAAETTFGYKEKEMLGKNIKIILPEGWESGKGRVRGVKKDGKKVPLDIGHGEEKNSDNQMITLVMRNASEMERFERELIRRNEELGKLNNLMVGRELKMRELKRKLANFTDEPGDVS